MFIHRGKKMRYPERDGYTAKKFSKQDDLLEKRERYDPAEFLQWIVTALTDLDITGSFRCFGFPEVQYNRDTDHQGCSKLRINRQLFCQISKITGERTRTIGIFHLCLVWRRQVSSSH